MNPFHYQRAAAPEEAIHVVSATRGAKFLGGGTNLIDLMKYDVEHPTTLVDINHLSFTQVTAASDGTTTIGAGVRNRSSVPPTLCSLRLSSPEHLRNSATWPQLVEISCSAPVAITSMTRPTPSATSVILAPAALP
jgi:CO/xanthine dehydrogenase FAD-binding subunit